MLVVFSSAITVFFSGEIGRAVKKIFAIKTANLLIPLCFMTFLILYYSEFIVACLIYANVWFHHEVTVLTELLPFTFGARFLVHLLMLMGLTFIPSLLILLWRKYKKYAAHETFSYHGIICTLMWLFLVVLLSSLCMVQMNFCI